ncbi:MAG: alkaline phosphatase D family protein [Planctomycetota bacterium]
MHLQSPTLLTSAAFALLALAPAAYAQNTQLPSGVAVGDVTTDSAVLWARPAVPGPMLTVIAPDRSLQVGAQWFLSGTAAPLEPVKHVVGGLLPGTTYYHVSFDLAFNFSGGFFRTAHAPGAKHGLRFGVTGDARGDVMPFHSLRNLPRRNLAFLAHLGDTIYADVESPALPGVSQATTLEQYRIKQAEVLSPTLGLNALADARRTTALFAVIDDHEVTNDFAGGADPSTDLRFDQGVPYINETQLFANGIRAFQEFHPIAAELYGATGDARTAFKPKLYRARQFGDDAAIFLLDARSFRDTELTPANLLNPADVLRFLVESYDPSRTMLSAAQLAEVQADLAAAQQAGVTWKFVMVPEPIQALGVLAAEDRFEGYAAERAALLEFIRINAIDNVVFVAADIHGTLVNEVRSQVGPGGPQLPLGAFEITTGAIAYDAPFGPTVVGLAAQLGLIDANQFAFYNSLPVAGKEAFLRAVLDDQLAQFGLDSIGLDGGEIQATLLSGQWSATHTYGWTEFEIDQATQALTVTTYGVDPADVNSLPTVMQAFRVLPQ